ncbi:beta-glucosidase [Roseibium hamelinense]|uniref:Beta-glucosidase n=1 Tax=Roseibium hamelinense TaxID=150831 RepID=A0A562T9A8_9HYPH|nr:GH1 family beta-glucosidase [Roseibium hamelinense]MTI45392.1 beta-glucosidase [Roseibium hamelinense]TWI90237.1 beta-glucosidase [Roseibium hamelinense]
MPTLQSLAARFPNDFLFGVATAAYQIEGAAKKDGRGPSIWDAFSKMPGRVYKQHSGDIACDHYHLWESDLDLIKSLGVDAYRFSIAWPRILPDGRGPVNERGLDFYDRLIDGMVARGLKVYPTLYHWDLPLTLAADGGWTARSTAEAFAEYTDIVVRRLGDRMDALATINEPWCICHLSHLYGIHAPGEKSREAFAAAVHTLNLAHGLSVQAARAAQPDLPLGTVLNAYSIYPASNAPEDMAASERAFRFHNDIFMSPIFNGVYHDDILENFGSMMPIESGDLAIINQPLDWWGLNYYTPWRISEDLASETGYPKAVANPPKDDVPITDIGWEVDEDGLSDLLKALYQRYDLPPVYVTENGACYNEEPESGVVRDTRRTDYLEKHLAACADALTADIPLKGYFLWSLMDNFEWAEGYKMRFGIVHVDYSTQVRTLKNSGKWYRDLVGAHRADRP